MLNLNNIRLIAPYKVDEIKSTGLWELESFLKRKSIIGLDCETTGLDTLTNRIIMLQIGDIHKQFVIDVRYTDISSIYEWIKDKKIVGSNLKFDYSQFKHHYNWRLLHLYDTMLVEKILNNNKKEEIPGYYSLAEMAERYLKAEFTPYIKQKGKKIFEQGSLFPELSFSKSTRVEFTKIKEEPFTKRQIIYGANDVWMPLLIRRYQIRRVRKDSLSSCVKLEHRFLPVLAEMELNGVYLNSVSLLEQNKICEQKEIEALDKLLEIEAINWNSSPQVTKVFKKLGIPTAIVDVKKSYGDNLVYKDSVAELHIAKYKDKFPLIIDYLNYKGLKKLTSTYGEKFLKNIHPVTERIHSNFYQMVTTGRLASSAPNVQNLPTEETYPGFRSCFKAQSPNHTLVISDYSGQESRIIADMSQDKAMLEFFSGKESDIHSFTAARMFKVVVKKSKKDENDNIIVQGINEHLRQIGKVLNFMIPYGGGAHKLSKSFQTSLKEAEDFIKKYYETYPDLESYFAKAHHLAKQRGFITINKFSNRRVYLKDFAEYKQLESFITRFKNNGWSKYIPKKVWSRFYTIKGDIEREAQNYSIQGSGADMSKLAACLFFEYCLLKKLDAKLVLMVHDELVVECDTNIAKRISKILKQCMEEAGRQVLEHNKVSIIADPVISTKLTH